MEIEISFKSLVIDAFRKLNLLLPVFNIVYDGPPHDRRFKCHLRVDDTHFVFTYDKIFTSLWKKMVKQAENSASESLLLYMESLNMIKVLDLHRFIVDEYKVENDVLHEENALLRQRIEELEDIVANEFDDEDLGRSC